MTAGDDGEFEKYAIETLESWKSSYVEQLQYSDEVGKLGMLFVGVAEEMVNAQKERDSKSKELAKFVRVVGSLALVFGLLALVGCSLLGHGFGQILLGALGSALLTFVLIDLLMHRLINIPSKELKKSERNVERWEETLTKSVPLMRQARSAQEAGSSKIKSQLSLLESHLSRNRYEQ